MPRPTTHKSTKSAKRPNRAAPTATATAAAAATVVAANSAAVLPTPSAQIDALTGDPDFMTSLARGLAVIQAFSQKKRQLTISQVSNKTGFSRAAVRRCLYTLAKLGFAGSDDNRHFFLQPRVLALGHSYISSMPLATAAHPILERFSRMMHESCSIATLDGLDIVYVARANVTRIMAIDLGVGSRLPAFCTSMGRVLLANLPPDELESCLARIEFTRHTERTIVTADRLRPVLRMVLRNGYAIVDQELELGLRSMAVPILSPSGQVVAAVNVGAHAQRVSNQEMLNNFLPQLRAAAQELCMLLR
jgi:IclR family pca regulon transcriptional regulator